MFSCCALFSQADDPADMEHLKALDATEVLEALKEGEINLAVYEDGLMEPANGSSQARSPRLMAAQQSANDAASAARKAETEAVMAKMDVSESEVEGRTAQEVATLAQEAARAAEAEEAAAKEARAAAQAEAEAATAEKAEQAMRALREAESAAHAAAEEAEKRRMEEEASTRAARQAESEARKALWRAEEAQKAKEQAGTKAAEEAREAHRIAQEEVREEQREKAELAREQAAAAKMAKARESLMSRLLSDEGVRLLKHGRNGKSATRTLKSPDSECTTLTWGKTLYHLGSMMEARKGTDPDPANPGLTGTSELRRSKAGSAALERSFSLLFPSRSLDFTVPSKDESEQLVLGFRGILESLKTQVR